MTASVGSKPRPSFSMVKCNVPSTHADHNAHLRRVGGMLCNVGEAFLDDAIDGCTNFVGPPIEICIGTMEIHFYCVFFAPFCRGNFRVRWSAPIRR